MSKKNDIIPGRFERLRDVQWELLLHCFPEQPKVRGKGHPQANRRIVLNSILYVLITGSRWCDLPTGEQWGTRVTSHRWLVRWKREGILEQIKQSLRSLAHLNR
jgi:transposase